MAPPCFFYFAATAVVVAVYSFYYNMKSQQERSPKVLKAAPTAVSVYSTPLWLDGWATLSRLDDDGSPEMGLTRPRNLIRFASPISSPSGGNSPYRPKQAHEHAENLLWTRKFSLPISFFATKFTASYETTHDGEELKNRSALADKQQRCLTAAD